MVIVRGLVPGAGWGRCPVHAACSPLVFAPPLVAASPVAPLWVPLAAGFGDRCPEQRAWPWGAAVPAAPCHVPVSVSPLQPEHGCASWGDVLGGFGRAGAPWGVAVPLLLSASYPSFLSLLLPRCCQLDPAASAPAPSQVPYPCPQELSASTGNLPLSSVCRWAGVCARASCWSVRLSPPRAAAESGQGGPASSSRSLGHSKPSQQGTAGAGCLSPGSLVAAPGSPWPCWGTWWRARHPGCCQWRWQEDGGSQPGWGGQGLPAGRERAEPG